MQVKTHRLIYQTNGTLTQQSVGTFSPFPRFEPFHSEQFGMLSAYLMDSDIASIQDKATDSLILVISISYTREADARRFRKAAIYLLNDSEEWVRDNHPSIDQGRVANIREKVLDYLAREKDEFGVDLHDIPPAN